MQIEFEMSMMRELELFLGIKIYQCINGVYIHQTKYTKELLKKLYMLECKPMAIQMHQTCTMCKVKSNTKVDQKIYKVMMGLLLY